MLKPIFVLLHYPYFVPRFDSYTDNDENQLLSNGVDIVNVNALLSTDKDEIDRLNFGKDVNELIIHDNDVDNLLKVMMERV